MNSKLTEKDQQIIFQCLKCVYEGNFIWDSAFSPRIGISRPAFKLVLDTWPDVDDSNHDSDAYLGINNALNEVCHGIRFSASEWNEWFDVNRDEVQMVFKRWKLSVAG